MKMSALLGAAAAAAGLSLAVSAPAMAQTVVFPAITFTEGAAGFVGPIPGSSPVITIGSDGEIPFDPFHAGFDTSDGIQLFSNWTPDPAFASAFKPGFWTQLPGTFTWVLPAVIPGCGHENEPTCEPVAKWDFPEGQWGPLTNSVILLQNGRVSDRITLANENGMATITFASDFVPEPATWAILLVGVGAIGAAMRTARRRDRMPTAVA